MRIYGMFRGFPGLGRVVAGISVLSTLKEMGHEVKAFTYLQGINALINHEIDLLTDEQPPLDQITAIGLNPISEIAGKLIEMIREQNPDLVILDGEPLLVSTLSMVFPRERILSVLNPTDLHNPSLPDSTLLFYHMHYLSAGAAIVHGPSKDRIILPEDLHGCDVLRTNTILRQQVLGLSEVSQTDIAVILGGGTCKASDNFWNSTVNMGKKVLAAAKSLPEELFAIYCNDSRMADTILQMEPGANVRIVADYCSPETIFSSAKVIICRAGRNTISEILYLDRPAVLMPSSGDFRSKEQESNIELACSLNPGRIYKMTNSDLCEGFTEMIKAATNSVTHDYHFIPGNDEAIEFVLKHAANNSL